MILLLNCSKMYSSLSFCYMLVIASLVISELRFSAKKVCQFLAAGQENPSLKHRFY